MFADVVQSTNVRMGELGDGARFAVEAFAELPVGSEVVRKNLDRHRAIEARFSAFVHLAHASRADLRSDFVNAEARTERKGQALVMNYTGRAAVRTDYYLVTSRKYAGRPGFVSRRISTIARRSASVSADR